MEEARNKVIRSIISDSGFLSGEIRVSGEIRAKIRATVACVFCQTQFSFTYNPPTVKKEETIFSEREIRSEEEWKSVFERYSRRELPVIPAARKCPKCKKYQQWMRRKLPTWAIRVIELVSMPLGVVTTWTLFPPNSLESFLLVLICGSLGGKIIGVMLFRLLFNTLLSRFVPYYVR